ncbi:ABC-2 family transporter protein [Planctomycetes bacterium Pan216]|uniref:ABC-2 family transporter protein n=1 Tax=Kolteria novifilia TaxID=2527975 RepID=A0A518B1U1_9BACT|nr:ABC-2 family transporter protein [Planctomycetes bacterium Pan216]
MIRALVLKELRETIGFASIALAVSLAIVNGLMGRTLLPSIDVLPQRIHVVPFAGGVFVAYLSYVVIPLAIALGYRQATRELGNGVYLFLFHRPIARSTLILTKLGVGIAVMLVVQAIPILLFGWWAATPGNHPSPFEWSMTRGAWQFMLFSPIVYAGAFLTGLRPGRWIGTRLLPLAASGLYFGVVMMVPDQWWLRIPVAAVFYGLLAVDIRAIASERDYG